MHINPNSGPGGRDNSVMSLGKDVIERKNSLSAYMSHTVNPRLLAKKKETHVGHARICRPQFERTSHRSEQTLSQFDHPVIVASPPQPFRFCSLCRRFIDDEQRIRGAGKPFCYA